eukprot:11901132-Alexandrium_andersonii.AAC.1
MEPSLRGGSTRKGGTIGPGLFGARAPWCDLLHLHGPTWPGPTLGAPTQGETSGRGLPMPN